MEKSEIIRKLKDSLHNVTDNRLIFFTVSDDINPEGIHLFNRNEIRVAIIYIYNNVARTTGNTYYKWYTSIDNISEVISTNGCSVYMIKVKDIHSVIKINKPYLWRKN